MRQPWALGDLIINEGIDWRLATWVSTLGGALGLPVTRALPARRTGRHPAIGGLDRSERRLILETILGHATAATRSAARRQLLQVVNPDHEETQRLTISEWAPPGVAPDGVLLALGPWDITVSDAGAWTVRDLLSPAKATVTGTVAFADGPYDRQRAILIDDPTDVNLDAAVSAISGEDTLTVRIVAKMPAAHDGAWGGAVTYLWDVRGADNNHRISLTYNTADDTFKVYINGANQLSSAAQTFEAGDWIELVVTLDFASDAYALYIDGTSADTDDTSLSAPTLTAWRLGSDYVGANWAGISVAEYQVFDTTMSAAEVAWIARCGALKTRHVDVLCERCDPWQPRGRPLDRGLVSTLLVDGDVRWRSRDGDVVLWTCSDADETTTVDVDSDDEVYPVIRLTPQTAKTSGFLYKRWVSVVWKADATVADYPVVAEALDLSAHAQADGDDIRVYVDGTEVDRWLGGTLVSAVNVWFNLDFEPAETATLGVAIGAGDTITEIIASTDISGFPSEGLLQIDSEVFTYTSINTRAKRFEGVSRATRGTAAADHTTTDTIIWIQHDVWIYYGDATLTAPAVDADYEPVFDLDASDNDVWEYDEFGSTANPTRPGRWTYEVIVEATYAVSQYTATQGGTADPWTVLGLLHLNGAPASPFYGVSHMYLYNPCGIVSSIWGNSAGAPTGEKRYSYPGGSPLNSYWYPYIRSSVDGEAWQNDYEIPDISGEGTWETWYQSVAAHVASARYIDLYNSTNLGANANGPWWDLGCGDVQVTLDATYTPDVTAGSEQANYAIEATLTNQTTGEAIMLTANLDLSTTLIVDTDQTVVRLSDGTRLLSALELDSNRRDWLRLLPGENALRFQDVGTVEVKVEILWDRRLFE